MKYKCQKKWMFLATAKRDKKIGVQACLGAIYMGVKVMVLQ